MTHLQRTLLPWILVILYILFGGVVWCDLVDETTLFLNDMCNVSCGDRKHTMCRTDGSELPTCMYQDFHLFNFSRLRSLQIQENLIFGFNGIRERIAHTFKIPNMLELSWDRKLQLMAQRYLERCTPFEDDECTNQNLHDPKYNIKRFFNNNIDSSEFIGSNRFCINSQFFPRDLAIRAMRTWYATMYIMATPIYKYNRKALKLFGYMKGTNNFTNMACPYACRVGCSGARYDLDNIHSIYCIQCNYYPTYRGDENHRFEYGEPGKNCPQLFPLNHDKFKGICSAGLRVIGAMAAHQNINHILIIICVILNSLYQII